MSTSLTVVVPAFNEADVLDTFHARLKPVLDELEAGEEIRCEVLYVNDGSTDQTRERIETLAATDARVSQLYLSRNFGKEIALTAGLDHATSDAVVVIDADLQDPPELITQLVAKWQEGFDIVYAQRTERAGESWLKKFTASGFYQLMRRVSRHPLPADTGDFRLLSRRALDALGQLRERHRFMKGLFTWVGYPQTGIPYKRDPRFAGDTKWSYWNLWNFALDGITSFTTFPLKAATYVGIMTAIGAFFFGLFIILRTLFIGVDMPGYASLMVVVLFLGGIQLTALGVIGEYLGRTFDEVKNRPLYLVEHYQQAQQEVRETGADRP